MLIFIILIDGNHAASVVTSSVTGPYKKECLDIANWVEFAIVNPQPLQKRAYEFDTFGIKYEYYFVLGLLILNS